MKHILYLSLLALPLFLSCKKESTDDTVKADPVFTLSAPAENQVYEFGDTVKINGTISADYEMHGYEVRLYNVASGMNVLNQGYHEHANSFVVSESWKNTVSDTSQMKIIIDAAIDHDGTVKTLERTITCYPQ